MKRKHEEIDSRTHTNPVPAGIIQNVTRVLRPKYEEIDSNTDIISSVPVEIIQNVTRFLRPKEAVYFASCSQDTLFKVQRNLTLNKKVHDMATLVAYGQQKEAHDLLAESPNTQELLLTPTSFTDYSGRTFYCTAYEYAYWAKDTHMCRMLEQLMVADTKKAMKKRCEAIENDGLTFKQHSEIKNSKHFDFTPLKEALSNYADGFNNWNNTGNYTAMQEAWMAVGMAQRDAPVHVINEYCRPDRSFDPVPPFDEPTLPRVLTYHHFSKGKEKAVFPLKFSDSSGLGVDIALVRVTRWLLYAWWKGAACRGCGAHGAWGVAVGFDLSAICRLDEIRTADLTRSREILNSAEPEQALGMTY